MSKRAEILSLIQELKAQGFQVQQVKRGGHWLVAAPDGRKMQITSSPRSDSGVRNARARLARVLDFNPRAGAQGLKRKAKP